MSVDRNGSLPKEGTGILVQVSGGMAYGGKTGDGLYRIRNSEIRNWGNRL